MVAHCQITRRWFITNATIPPDSPFAGPVDGYYSTLADAERAKAIMIECFNMRPQDLVIRFEDDSRAGA